MELDYRWILLFFGAVQSAPLEGCFNHLKWTSEKGMILLNGEPFHLKGTSWFGLETDGRAPHGLTLTSLDDIIVFLAQNDFNALRLPFSVDLILNSRYPPAMEKGRRPWNHTAVDCIDNPDICELAPIELLETIIDRLGAAGILVLLDQHRIKGPQINELWYNADYPESAILESWDILMARVGHKWNLLGLDLKNEPHGAASWGLGDLSTDWNAAAERIIRHISDQNPAFQGLFFVNGVGEKADSPYPVDRDVPHWWGGNLEGVLRHPINVGGLNNRVVYSPHVYGPDVFRFPYFQAEHGFPENLPSIWHRHFGFVEELTGRAVVVGEWGGVYREGTDDQKWQDKLAYYLIDTCLSDNFYWALNPNSGETGGLLLDDWTTPRMDKLGLLRRVQPEPSGLIRVQDGRFCFLQGHFASPRCRAKFMAPTEPSTAKPKKVPGPPGEAAVESIPTTEAVETTRYPTVTVTAPTTVTETTIATNRAPPVTERPPNKAFSFIDPIQSTRDEGVAESVPRRKESGSPFLQFHAEVAKHWRNKYGETVRQYDLFITNTSPNPLCPGSTIRLESESLRLDGSPGVWNLDKVWEDPNTFRLPHWSTIHPGEASSGIGMILVGKEKPQFSAATLVQDC